MNIMIQTKFIKLILDIIHSSTVHYKNNLAKISEKILNARLIHFH